MKAYKGFNPDMTCTLGKGRYQYEVGKTYEEEKSRCARGGLHCAEYILDCLGYYPLRQGNRYCEVEAAGSIDEDAIDSKISCTSMTVIRELTLPQMVVNAMGYMLLHPERQWEKTGTGLCVAKDTARAGSPGEGIVIARGPEPRAWGQAGAVIGLMQETEPGLFGKAAVIVAETDTWYRLDKDGNIVEEKR